MDIKFRKPGAFQPARWMVNIMYYGKMLLFSRQLDYSTQFLTKLHRFMRFIAMIYRVPRLRSQLTLEAVAVDLALQKYPIRYSILDTACSYDRAVLQLPQHQ